MLDGMGMFDFALVFHLLPLPELLRLVGLEQEDSQRVAVLLHRQRNQPGAGRVLGDYVSLVVNPDTGHFTLVNDRLVHALGSPSPYFALQGIAGLADGLACCR